MKKILSTLAIFVLLMTSMSLAKPAEATFNVNPCHYLPWLCTTPTPTPTPTLTPTETPSVTPTETPEVSVTPTETPYPCDQEVTLLVLTDNEVVPCVSETPTPTPTETPKPEQPLTAAGAPHCEGVSFVKLPANVHVVRSGSDASVRWTPTQGGEVSIFFFENEHPSNRFGYKTNNDGNDTVHFLGSKNWTFEVQQWDGCATSGLVQVIDSSAPMLFRALPYIW